MPNFKVYEEHWQLLVESVYLLMNQTVSTADVLQAQANLKKFVGETELYYSPRTMTFNVHQLLHLCQSVLDWGPLWAHNGYGFESGNGKIKRMIKAAKGVLHQVCRSLDFRQSAVILEQHINEHKRESPVIAFCNFLNNRFTANSVKLSEYRYFGKASITSQRWIEEMQLSDNSTASYYRMLKDNCIFDSCQRRVVRSKNCFARTCGGVYIVIVEFIVDSENETEYTLYRVVTTERSFRQCSALVGVVRIEEDVRIIETSSVHSIAVCTNINAKRYISTVPNLFHYS